MKFTFCSLDVVNPRPISDILDSISPSLLSIINSSLVSGIVPSHFKQAIMQPLLKKPNLDPTVLNNYRPISKLLFPGSCFVLTIHASVVYYFYQV